ncbi:hypothetical protein [Hwanghaeella sp. LZ110]|uniref:hypothetical protein n=1 Tax=Hwanghaeella sp. LZ110 TaxID=3402810 RepID=UPI003B67BDCF
MMGIVSVWHWFIVLIFIMIFVVPSWMIAKKAGRSGALGLLNIFPGIGTIIYMVILAFGKWPHVDGEQ